MKAVAIFLLVLNAVLALHFPFEVRNTTRVSRQDNVNPGSLAYKYDFGFMVLLMNSYYGTAYCSGALIKPKWVLTTLSCIDNIEPHDLLVLAGDVDFRQYISKGHPYDTDPPNSDIQSRQGQKFFTRAPSKGIEYNVALIRLEDSFTRPHIVPAPVSRQHASQGQPCSLFGWGYTKIPPAKDYVLLFANDVYPKPPPGGCGMEGSVYRCVSSYAGRVLCDWDYGSPLMCDGYVFGLFSFYNARNNPGANCTMANEYYFFETVYVADWIEKTSLAVINSKSLLLYAVPFLLSAMWSIKI